MSPSRDTKQWVLDSFSDGSDNAQLLINVRFFNKDQKVFCEDLLGVTPLQTSMRGDDQTKPTGFYKHRWSHFPDKERGAVALMKKVLMVYLICNSVRWLSKERSSLGPSERLQTS